MQGSVGFLENSGGFCDGGIGIGSSRRSRISLKRRFRERGVGSRPIRMKGPAATGLLLSMVAEQPS